MICERVKRYTAIPASFRDASLRHASDDTASGGMGGGESVCAYSRVHVRDHIPGPYMPGSRLKSNAPFVIRDIVAENRQVPSPCYAPYNVPSVRCHLCLAMSSSLSSFPPFSKVEFTGSVHVSEPVHMVSRRLDSMHPSPFRLPPDVCPCDTRAHLFRENINVAFHHSKTLAKSSQN